MVEIVARRAVEAERHHLAVALHVALKRDGEAPADMRGVEQRPVSAVVDVELVAAALFDAHDQRAILGRQRTARLDRKSTRLNSRHSCASRMPSSACKKQKTT